MYRLPDYPCRLYWLFIMTLFCDDVFRLNILRIALCKFLKLHPLSSFRRAMGKSLLECFAAIEDPRRGRVTHDLVEMLVIGKRPNRTVFTARQPMAR
jgi:hypothetical protein